MPISIYQYASLSSEVKNRLFNRSSADYDQVKSEILPTMNEVKKIGDMAILKKYQQRQLPVDELLVSNQEYFDAYQKVDKKFLDAFYVARANLEKVCLSQKKSLSDTSQVTNNGVKVWREWKPIQSVGIYVPGGRANYPSSLLMCAVPAIAAGCTTLVVCVPPNKKGELPAELLVTAKELGITKVYKVGGPQAIAAMAYGTQTIPKVTKIVGPGNQYVNAAKLIVFPQTAIDLPAGPSENLIIADDTANPQFVAIDLITDAEHGPDSTAILVTNSQKLAAAVQKEIKQLLKIVPTQETIVTALKNYGAIILVNTMDEAVEVSNTYAPEHMQIMTKEPAKIAQYILNAGSVFIGPWSAKAMGDYASGANHVLPTGQAAVPFGGLSVDGFGKWVEFQLATRTGFLKLSQTIETYATVENLPAHKLSSKVRRNYDDKKIN